MYDEFADAGHARLKKDLSERNARAIREVCIDELGWIVENHVKKRQQTDATSFLRRIARFSRDVHAKQRARTILEKRLELPINPPEGWAQARRAEKREMDARRKARMARKKEML